MIDKILLLVFDISHWGAGSSSSRRTQAKTCRVRKLLRWPPQHSSELISLYSPHFCQNNPGLDPKKKIDTRRSCLPWGCCGRTHVLKPVSALPIPTLLSPLFLVFILRNRHAPNCGCCGACFFSFDWASAEAMIGPFVYVYSIKPFWWNDNKKPCTQDTLSINSLHGATDGNLVFCWPRHWKIAETFCSEMVLVDPFSWMPSLAAKPQVWIIPG